MKSELTAHALHMVESKENDRRENLKTAHNIDERKKEKNVITAEKKSIEQSISKMEGNVLKHRQAASGCWSEYQTKKNSLLSMGTLEEQVLKSISGKAAECRAHEGEVKIAKNELSQLQSQFSRVSSEKSEADADLSKALTTIKNKVEEANKIESAALNPNSVLVLKDLISKDKAAKAKWIIISLVVMICELLPFLIKAMLGQSAIGMRIAGERITARLDVENKIMQKQQDAAIHEALYEATQQATLEIRNNPQIKMLFLAALERYISALAPLEGARAMMTEIERSQVDVNDFIGRFPRFASLISEAWASAIQEASRAIRGAASGATGV